VSWAHQCFLVDFIIYSNYRRRRISNHDFEYTRVDANISERLTASPRVYDIYGHCGIGIMSEWFPHGDLENISIDYCDNPAIVDIQKHMEMKEPGG
jgi:hypothetical protein